MDFEGDGSVTKETFANNADKLQKAAAVFVPQNVTVFGLSCTSMAYTLGPEKVDNQFVSVDKRAKSTDMFRSVVAALNTLKVKKAVLLTPYLEEMHAANVKLLESQGV
jgi:maleate cis-trans isomerase